MLSHLKTKMAPDQRGRIVFPPPSPGIDGSNNIKLALFYIEPTSIFPYVVKDDYMCHLFWVKEGCLGWTQSELYLKR